MTDPGNVHLEPDRNRPGASVLFLGGVAQSSVDPEDPTFVGLAPARRMADALDLAASPGVALRAVHLGGGGLSLPRYLAAARAGSESIVFELHRGMLAAVRWLLGDPPAGIEVRHGDARAGIESCPEQWADVVVNDVFEGRALLGHMGTAELLAAVRRVLRPGGFYVNNVIDYPPMPVLRGRAATALAAFDDVVAVGAPGVLEGARGGNAVLFASDVPLPYGALRERAAAADPPWSAADRGAVEALAGDATVLHDGPDGAGRAVPATRERTGRLRER